jgi:hypothetical protein
MGMKSRILSYVIFVLIFIPFSMDAKEGSTLLNMKVDLRDGSTIFGVMDPAAIHIKNDSIGNAVLRMEFVSSITMHGDGNKVLIDFKNGDRISGSIDRSTFNFKVAFGDVVIPIKLVEKISMPFPVQTATIAYWRFENGEANSTASGKGTVLDSSGNGFNGTAYGGPHYRANVMTNPVPKTGAQNAFSLEFNGINDRVFISDNLAFQLTHSLTIEAYVNIHSIAETNSWRYIFFRGDDRGGLDPYVLWVFRSDAGSTIGFEIKDANNEGGFVTALIPAFNQWFHVAGTLDDSTGAMKLYINGDFVSSITTMHRPMGPLDSGRNPGLGIGDLQNASSQQFDGLIDEVRISDQALLPSQFLFYQSSKSE